MWKAQLFTCFFAVFCVRIVAETILCPQQCFCLNGGLIIECSTTIAWPFDSENIYPAAKFVTLKSSAVLKIPWDFLKVQFPRLERMAIGSTQVTRCPRSSAFKLLSDYCGQDRLTTAASVMATTTASVQTVAIAEINKSMANGDVDAGASCSVITTVLAITAVLGWLSAVMAGYAAQRWRLAARTARRTANVNDVVTFSRGVVNEGYVDE